MVSVIGQRVKKQRQTRGLSLRELARASLVDVAIISRLESGARASGNISVDVLRKLARTLGCSADWLIDLYGDAEEQPTAR